MPQDVFSQRIARKLAEKKAYADKVRVKIEPVSNPYLKPGEKPDYSGFTFSVKRGSKEVLGSGHYSRPDKAVDIGAIFEPKSFGKAGTLEDAHPLAKGTSMDPGMIRGALEKVKKIFPKAETLEGMRVTGMRAKNFLAGEAMQRFSLAKAAKLAREVK